MDSKAFLAKRRDRAIATILSYKDSYVDQYLPTEISQELRLEIMAQINDLCDLAFDLLASGVVFNEEFLDRFDQVYDAVLGADGRLGLISPNGA